MNPRYMLIIGLIFLLACGIVGCTDKTENNPTRVSIAEKGLVMQSNDKFFAVFASTAHNGGHLGLRFYIPPDYNWGGTGGYYPTLYMLAPFNADDRYFFEHRLADVADRLINEGKIQPMIIVTFDGRSHLGGSFFTNSILQGYFFDALWYDFLDLQDDYGITGEAVMTKIEKWLRAFEDRDKRAICGVGMGGYGAFKSAVESNLFSSVSAVNAPLDFDGTGSGGFLGLLNEIYPPGSQWIFLDSTLKIDTTFSNGDIVGIDTSVVGIDTLGYGVDTVFLDAQGEPTISAEPEMLLILSAAAAFSPHHTGFIIDSLYYDQFDVLSISTTVTDTLTSDLRSYLSKYAVHMPFDSTGALNSAIWQHWMDHNIESLYANADPANAAYFETMPKLLIRSAGAEFHYDQQMDGFIQFLNANAMAYQLETFSGNQVLTGTADHFIYDLLDEILIFHSENFGD